MSQFTLFIDDGGVMNDNSLRGPQWQYHVSQFFVPLLGGSYEAWGRANRLLMESILEPENWRRRTQAAPDFISFDRAYQRDWVIGMCQLVGVEPPATEEECICLGQQAVMYITRRVQAAFPGVVETLLLLHQQGYTLHTASSETSLDLEGYLEGMGVRTCFGPRLYGSDLLNSFKDSPQYYERLFADTGVSPAAAVIIDDRLDALVWAQQCGARTVHICSAAEPCSAPDTCISSLTELPRVLRKHEDILMRG